MALPPSIELLLRQSARGVGRINSKTSAISGALTPFAPRVAGYYQGLQGNEQALGGALQGSLAQTGAQLGSSIGGALQGIQAPAQAVAQYGGGQATTGAQSGAAVGALSSTDLERLHSQGTAEQIYAAALPRLAQLAGDQERRAFLDQASQQLSDLSLEESKTALANYQDQRAWNYKVAQDRKAMRRQKYEDRLNAKKVLYERKRQKRLDQLATMAARQEYGFKSLSAQQAQERVGVSQGGLAVRAQSAAETTRHHHETEAEARARLARQQAKDAKSGQKTNAGLHPASEATNRSYGYIMGYTAGGKLVPFRGPGGKPVKYKPKPSSSSSSSSKPTGKDVFGGP